MTPEETRKKALALLDRRDYGSEELCAKLIEKGAEPDEARAAVRYMIRVGFIDDERYAAMVARHYAAKGYGAGRVREELRRRKLDRELWDAALAELPEPEGIQYARPAPPWCGAASRGRPSGRRPTAIWLKWSWKNEGRNDIPRLPQKPGERRADALSPARGRARDSDGRV